jgi:hypothetical protein
VVKHPAGASVESGVSSDGLATALLAASAGASFHDSSNSG